MRFSEETVRAAFERHEAVYHAKPAWNIAYHIQCWDHAHRAFDGVGSAGDFEWIYGQLRSHWGAFRNASGPCWSAAATRDYLLKHAAHWREISLRDVGDQHLRELDSLLMGMAGIKPITHGPSMVAISKVLHFLNPRLFVIVDDAVIWRWVLAHRWLWMPIESVRHHVAGVLGRGNPPGEACDPVSYLAIMRWCADLLRSNPLILRVFTEHIARHNHGSPLGRPVEAAAAEWFLLGVVELPPSGVTPEQAARRSG